MNKARLLKHVCPAVAAVALCALALPAGAQYSNAVLNLNPILYYHLNDTTPVPGNVWSNAGTAGPAGTLFGINYGLNSTYFQQPGPLVAEGANSYAAEFDGTSTWGDIPYSPAMDPSKGNPNAPFTVEGWYFFEEGTAWNNGNGSPVCFGDDGNVGNGWGFYLWSSEWEWQLYNETGGWSPTADLTTPNSPPAPYEWSHVVLVWDGTNASMYLNGTLAAGPKTAPGFVPMESVRFVTLGLDYDFTWWCFWPGYMADFAVYTNALSSDTILAHYTNGTSAASIPGSYESMVMTNNPLLFYEFNDPAYTTPISNPTLTKGGDVPGPFQTGQPLAQNLGSLGTNYDGTYEPGTETGLAGAPCAGFGANSHAVEFAASGDAVKFGPAFRFRL